MTPRTWAVPLALAASAAACTDAGLYSVTGAGANLPDRATFGTRLGQDCQQAESCAACLAECQKDPGCRTDATCRSRDCASAPECWAVPPCSSCAARCETTDACRRCTRPCESPDACRACAAECQPPDDCKVCVPFAAGRFFPVKILFAVNGGTIVPPNDRAQVMDAITAAVQQYTSPFVTYGMVAFNDFAFNQVAGATFVKDKDLPAALVKYTGFNQPGPLSMLNALQMAEALVSGDMLTQCPGTLARTRYVVVLLTFGRDESDLTRCNLTPRTSACAGLCNPGSGRSCPPVACSTCLLGETTQRIVGLESRYKAGDVTVQPILVRTQSDPQISTQIAAVARGGGTREIETDLALLKGALGGLNLAALTRPMRLKALYAFNRFARARGGQLVLDSDGDGLADDDEAAICRRSSGTLCTCKDPPDTAIPGGCAPPADRCLDPLDADTDCDGLMDGLEVAVGTDPTVPTSVPGCAVCADTDADGLYDCEERLLGTEACMGDTDGDGLSDLVEFLSVTNPLEPELTRDTDRDGFSNLEEVMGHTDPSSSDLAFIGSRMSRVVWDDASPSADGRPCYAVRVSNVALAETKEVPAGVDVCRAPVGHGRGVNNIYLYMVSAPEDDFSSAGVARLTIEPVTFIAPHTRQPADPIIPLFDGSLRTKP